MLQIVLCKIRLPIRIWSIWWYCILS